VDTESVTGKISLHPGLKVFTVNAFENELGYVAEGVILRGEEGVEVAGQTAGVVLVVAVDVFGIGKIQRAEVDGEVGEGAGLNAAAAGAGGHVDALGVEVGVAAVGDVFAVGTHAVLVTGEERRILRC
jgi:hypothetical protein